MRMSKVDPATAKTQAEKAVAAGVMESNADNAIFKISGIRQRLDEPTPYHVAMERIPYERLYGECTERIQRSTS